MRKVKTALGGELFTLRAYDHGGLIVDSLMRKLALKVVDDYCNPPGFAWAALIFRPMEAIKEIQWKPKELWPEPNEEELRFLNKADAVIVKVGRRPEVQYFTSAREAWHEWIKLKQEAEQWGFERRSGA